MEELRDKVVAITGGAGGIGRALAECFLADGAKVMLGDLDEAALTRAADDLADRGAVATCKVDVTEQASTDQLLAATVDAFGAAPPQPTNSRLAASAHARSERERDIGGSLLTMTTSGPSLPGRPPRIGQVR